MFYREGAGDTLSVAACDGAAWYYPGKM